MFCFVFSKSFLKSATCFRLSLGLLTLPWLLGQEGKDSEPGDRQGGACLRGLGLRSGPKEVNSSCSWQNRTSELMPLHWPAPSLLSAVPLLGMLFSSQYFLSTNIPIRIEPVLGPAAGLTGERPPRPGPRDKVRSGVSVRAGRTEPKTPAPSGLAAWALRHPCWPGSLPLFGSISSSVK